MADEKSNKPDTAVKKLQRAEDGRKAVLDYEKEAAALRAKTERLKALRLARDAEAQPGPAPAKASRSKTSVKTPKAKPGPLSEWLDDQRKDGRRD